MPRTVVETEITDKWGTTHKYQTVPLPFDKAIDLKLDILKIVIRPLGDAFGELLGSASGLGEAESLGGAPSASGGPEEAHVDDPGDSFDVTTDSVDWSRLGELLEQLPERLIAAGGSRLLARILHDTSRISPPAEEGEKSKRLQLRDPKARDAAFSAGNWPECYKAVAWILGVNYSPFSTDNSSDWKSIWSDLRDLLPAVRGEG